MKFGVSLIESEDVKNNSYVSNIKTNFRIEGFDNASLFNKGIILSSDEIISLEYGMTEKRHEKIRKDIVLFITGKSLFNVEKSLKNKEDKRLSSEKYSLRMKDLFYKYKDMKQIFDNETKVLNTVHKDLLTSGRKNENLFKKNKWISEILGIRSPLFLSNNFKNGIKDTLKNMFNNLEDFSITNLYD